MIKYIAQMIIENVSKRIEKKTSKHIIKACEEMNLISHVAKKRLNDELAGFSGIIENANNQIEHLMNSRLTEIENNYVQRILKLEDKLRGN